MARHLASGPCIGKVMLKLVLKLMITLYGFSFLSQQLLLIRLIIYIHVHAKVRLTLFTDCQAKL